MIRNLNSDDFLYGWKKANEKGRYILDFFHPEEDVLFTSKKGKIYSINQDNERGK